MLVSKTINPLHFEDLDPHRFEDLVRQIMYDFKDWKSIEAVGRSGADTGIDILATEGIILDSKYEDDEELRTEERIWMIQCKREKVITPQKIIKIIEHDLGNKADLPYGYIIVASSQFSKKTRDAFKSKLNSLGIKEFYLFGKSELEDLLFLPKYDHLLFAYFGISIQKRLKTIKTLVLSRQTTKRKLIKTLGDFSEVINKTVLIRPSQNDDYPKIKKTVSPLLWRYYNVLGYAPLNHISIMYKKYPAYLNWETKEWDVFESADLSFPNNPELFDLSEDYSATIRKMREVGFAKLEEVDPMFRGFFIIMKSIHFDRILLVDELGDVYNEPPHLVVEYNKNSPFEDKTYRYIEEDKLHYREVLMEPLLENRIKIFKYKRTPNTDNMGKLFVTLFAFTPALKTNL